jgi:5-methylcytosine-specific restriction protein A
MPVTAQRAFRTAESYEEERKTRDLLPKFLKSCRLRDIRDERTHYGQTQSQTIHASLPSGEKVTARVKLCWRSREGKRSARNMSAAQLMARIQDGEWEGSIRSKIESQRSEGITHMLIVKREAGSFRFAALLPLDSVIPIWQRQRDVSSRLIKAGVFGRRTKNHAMNGASPTIWLADEEAPEVADQLWHYPGVIDVRTLRTAPGVGKPAPLSDDTYDDLPGVDLALLGTDGAGRLRIVRSFVKRDPKVRAAVLRRSRGVCERNGCGATRAFVGFLDVHHILGADKSDRVYNCVALCPNCHREAHFAPNRDQLNQELLKIAGKRSRGPTAARNGKGSRLRRVK